MRAIPTLARLLRKIYSIVTSDLTAMDKVLYGTDLVKGRFAEACSQARSYRLRDGSTIQLRANSTDQKVFDEIFIERIYEPFARIADRLMPTALVDLGANIGLSAIFLAGRMKPAVMVAVEPDPGNFAALKENLRRSGLKNRCTAVQAFAGAERGFAQLVDSGNGEWGVRMGAMQDWSGSGAPVIPMDEILDMTDEPTPDVLLKCDIEGAEIHLFRNLCRWEHRVRYIILELHTEFLPLADFEACLDASRYHWRVDGSVSPGAVLGVMGLERLSQKSSGAMAGAAR